MEDGEERLQRVTEPSLPEGPFAPTNLRTSSTQPYQIAFVNALLTIPSIHLSNRKFTKITTMLTKPRPIRLKGRSFLALALTPELPFEDWLRGLDDLAARSAGFFLRRPVMLDVASLDIDKAELRDLVNKLGARNVRDATLWQFVRTRLMRFLSSFLAIDF